jgi:hypothetical protein
MYIENPKTKGSGLVACVPQKGKCPIGCEDCFFSGGRSYLEPLDKNLPNMPDPEEVIRKNLIVRVNDGNDSNIERDLVVKSVQCYPLKFYNTSIPKDLETFDAPVVLTLNPGKNTDTSFHKLSSIPKNLMFVRFRANTWNFELLDEAISYYGNVPIVLTWMAYFETAEKGIPERHKKNYVFRKRTLNSYWAITTKAWIDNMEVFRYLKNIYSCGHTEGENGDTKCKYCGNCIREFFSARIRMMG